MPTRKSLQYSSDMQLSTSDIGAAQLLSVTEIAPILMCEHKSYPVMVFRAYVITTRYKVNKA